MKKHGADLANPENVKLFIAGQETWSDGHKILAVYAYDCYCKMKGIQWTKPRYRNNESIPFVPKEKEIDALIAGTSKKISITLQALKETGFRIGELWKCKWTDLDEEKSTLKCRSEKHGRPREIKISSRALQIC
jgi:integrase